MSMKVNRVSPKAFVYIFSSINVVIGLVVGAFVTVASLFAPASPDDVGTGWAWAILMFPLLNGLFGLVGGALLVVMYNLFAKWFGGVELEVENF